MLKRLFDIVFSLFAVICLLPIYLIIALLVFIYDFHSPFYNATRIGKHKQNFVLYKFRSMIVDADKGKMDTILTRDSRITPIGRILRKYKLDELPQFFNVIMGHLAIVGPRPNIARKVNLYTEAELNLLTVKPGITDLSSIVFADIGDLLNSHQDANEAYRLLVRPWKSRLGLFYIQHACFSLDLKIIFATVVAIFSLKQARTLVAGILQQYNASSDLIDIVERRVELYPCAPPGAESLTEELQ